MYCIVSYRVLCMYLICYLYTIVLTKVTRNKDMYKYIRTNPLFTLYITRKGTTVFIDLCIYLFIQI
jgi:hypothetical protein